MARLDRQAPPQEPDEVPAGHSVPAHGLFGWCAACPRYSLDEELAAWREFAKPRVAELRRLM